MSAKKAAEAHTDLNTFASIVSILEGGHLYRPSTQRAKTRIIKICKEEQQKALQAYDEAAQP